MYPIEKYRFYRNGNKIIAVSTYAGKTVRGVAVCHEGDEFDEEKGKQLAAARCALKIAKKRVDRAGRKVAAANEQLIEAEDYYDMMYEYQDDAYSELYDAQDYLNDLLEDF